MHAGDAFHSTPFPDMHMRHMQIYACVVQRPSPRLVAHQVLLVGLLAGDDAGVYARRQAQP